MNNKVNLQKPIIYFCREAERAIGLENIIEDYRIACVEESSTVNQLRQSGVDIFCLEEHEEVEQKSTNTLLKSGKLKDWVGNNEFYALTFLPSKTVKYKIEQLGGVLLANEYDLYLKYENKIKSAEVLSEKSISIPDFEIDQIEKFNYQDLVKEFEDEFVLQTQRSHTGSGTFIIKNEGEFNNLKENLAGNLVKVSKKIVGDTFTINCVVGANKNYFGPIQYQITNEMDIFKSFGTTLGNDFVRAKKLLEDKPKVVEKIQVELEKVCNLMKDDGYIGLFGVDFIVNNENEVYIIEINARQTANIPFETQIELMEGKVPLQMVALVEMLSSIEPEGMMSMSRLRELEHKNDVSSSISKDAVNEQRLLTNDKNKKIETSEGEQALVHLLLHMNLDQSELQNLELIPYDQVHFLNIGSQIFIRSEKDGCKIINQPKSGAYRLQSDNSALDFANDAQIKENIIFLDESADKPLIFKSENYRLDMIESGFLITFQNLNSIKNKYEEMARIQLKQSVFNENGRMKKWVKEAYLEIKKLISN